MALFTTYYQEHEGTLRELGEYETAEEALEDAISEAEESDWPGAEEGETLTVFVTGSDGSVADGEATIGPVLSHFRVEGNGSSEDLDTKDRDEALEQGQSWLEDGDWVGHFAPAPGPSMVFRPESVEALVSAISTKGEAMGDPLEVSYSVPTGALPSCPSDASGVHDWEDEDAYGKTNEAGVLTSWTCATCGARRIEDSADGSVTFVASQED